LHWSWLQCYTAVLWDSGPWCRGWPPCSVNEETSFGLSPHQIPSAGQNNTDFKLRVKRQTSGKMFCSFSFLLIARGIALHWIHLPYAFALDNLKSTKLFVTPNAHASTLDNHIILDIS
jgi:hypothetical protein